MRLFLYFPTFNFALLTFNYQSLIRGSGLNFDYHRQNHRPALGLGEKKLADIVSDFILDIIIIGRRARVMVFD